MVNRISTTEQNYLKAIYHLQQPNGQVSTNQLSASLAVKASTATDMLKKLQMKEWVHYKPYRGFCLSESGSLVALQIIRRHRLWEYFLVKKLSIDWEHVHLLAEELEHIDSELLINKLATYLNNPLYDPHGDPIPDANGQMPINNRVLLSTVVGNKKVTIEAVANDSHSFLQLINMHQLTIGKKIKVLQTYDFDKSMQVQMGEQIVILSHQLTQQILVTEIK